VVYYQDPETPAHAGFSGLRFCEKPARRRVTRRLRRGFSENRATLHDSRRPGFAVRAVVNDVIWGKERGGCAATSSLVGTLVDITTFSALAEVPNHHPIPLLQARHGVQSDLERSDFLCAPSPLSWVFGGPRPGAHGVTYRHPMEAASRQITFPSPVA